MDSQKIYKGSIRTMLFRTSQKTLWHSIKVKYITNGQKWIHINLFMLFFLGIQSWKMEIVYLRNSFALLKVLIWNCWELVFFNMLIQVIKILLFFWVSLWNHKLHKDALSLLEASFPNGIPNSFQKYQQITLKIYNIYLFSHSI